MEGWKTATIGVVVAIAGVGAGYAVYKTVETQKLKAQFRKLGDVNGDGVIDQKDLDILQALFNTTKASSNWNPRADLNGDGIIDLQDFFICTQHQGLTYDVWLATRTLQLSCPSCSTTGYGHRGYTVQTAILPIKEI